MKTTLLFLAAFVGSLVVQAQNTAINWIKKNGPIGGEIMDIEVHSASGKVFLLDGYGRPFVSSDNGTTWQEISVSAGEQTFDDIEVINNTIFLVGYWELYASVDGGVTFQERMTDVSPYEGADRMKLMPSSGNLVVLTRQSDIYTSSNGGQTWTIKNSTLSGIETRFLQVNAVDQIFILKYDGSFVRRPFRSVDGGATFNEASTGIPAGHQVLGLYADNNGAMIYCVTAEGIYSTTNGNAWSSIKAGSLTDLIISDYGNRASLIEFSADGLGMFFVDNVNHKLHSKTLTATDWELQATDFPSAFLSVTAAAARDFTNATTSTAYFGTPTGVFKTTTGGASITEGNTGIASVRAQRLEVDNLGDLYIETEQTGLIKSKDDGNTWTKITTLNQDLRNFFTNQGGSVLYAHASDYRLMASYDQGASWPEISPLGTVLLWAGAVDEEKVFGLDNPSSPSLYYSANYGSTWATTAIGGLPASFSIDESSLMLASSERMLLALYDYDLAQNFYYRIDLVYDASNAITSATASKITTLPIPTSDIHRVAVANGKFYFYDTFGPFADRLAVSSDGGVTWTTRSVPESDDFFLVNNGYLFLSDGGDRKIHISRDDGATFQESILPSTIELWNLKDIALDESGYAYLAISGDYMYQSATTIVIPQTPTSLQQVGYSATAAALKWLDFNAYDRDIIIERSIDGTTFTEVGQVEGWSSCNFAGEPTGYYVDTTLEPATAYTYRILARNQAGSSLPSATITVTTLADCAPTLPENRSWSAINSGTEGYAPMAAPVSVGIKHLGGGKYEISDLSLGLTGSVEKSLFYESCGVTHVGYVENANPNGNGSWDGTTLTLKWRACYGGETETITLTLNPTDPVPAQPAALNAYVLSNTAIEINWPLAYYEKSYVLERSTNAVSGFSPIATIDYPTNRYVDNGPFSEGTTYYYRIKAINANPTPDESPYSVVTGVPFARPNFVVGDNAITNFVANATIASMWVDFNNDGLEDYFTMEFDAANQIGRPLIFKNLGAGSYEAVHPEFGTASYFWPSIADFDNDHYPDIALTGDGERVFDLFKGNGDFTFTKVPSAQLGDLAVIAKEISSSSWADINNDALLDIALLNQEDGGFTLYKQNADHSFTSIYTSPASDDETVMAIWSDYDNDGFQDVLLSNLDGQGGLYHNNGDETFSPATGNGFTGANFFAAAWGDYNNDGYVDIFCGSVSKNALYKNNGDGTFTEDLTTSISENNFTISASWGDFNNDGYLDLVTAGFPGYQTRLFIRDPSVTSGISFKKIITEKVNDVSTSHYSVASADPDQNGLLDLMLSAFIFNDEDGDAISPTNNTFYQNNNAVRNWSGVKLKGKSVNAESIGARITLTAGGKTQTREISAHSSLLSRNSTVAHFGLGSTTSITNVAVTWPGGAVQNYPLPPINQVLVIEEDLAGPVISSQTPTNNATAVSPNTSVTIVFDETPFAVAGKKIHFTRTGDVTPFTSIDVATGAKTGTQMLYTLPVSLQPLTEYNVTIEAGAFRDRFANASLEVTNDTWKFVTAAAPAITALSPLHNATNVSAQTNLSVTFDKPVTVVSGKLLKVFASTDLATPVQSIDVATGVVTDNTIVFALSSKLVRSVTYQVSIDAGAFTDGNGATFQGLASSDWKFTTDPGPSYTLSPAHNAVDLPIQASLQITFNKTITRIAGKKLTVMDGSTVLSEGDVSAIGTLASNTYTYPAPEGGWPHGRLLKVTVDEGAFADAAGNDSAPVALDTWNFTTIEAPGITAFSPLHNATNVSAQTNLSVTFDKPVTAVSGKLLKVYASTDLATPVQNIDVVTGVITNNTIVFTLSPKLARSVTYHVSIDAGAFTDGNGATFQGLTSSDWKFTTDPGPTYTLSPAHNAVDLPIQASLQITFNKTITRIAGKKLTVMDGSTVLSEGDVSAVGTLVSNTYTYPAPESGWPHGKLLKVTVDDGAFADAAGNESPPVVLDTWNFTIEAADVTPPVINFTNPGSLPKGFGTVSPSFTVADSKGVSTVVVSIRKISGASYTDLPATAGTAANSYTVALSETTHFDAIGAELYITATDVSGNTTRDPADPTATHKVHISYTAAQAAIPTTSLGLGGQKGSWKVFAIPFEIPSPNNGVTAIFNEIASTNDKKEFRLITYGTPTKWSEYPDAFSAINRGTGYFINIKQDPGAIALFDLTAPANHRSSLFEINLKQGWNMVGNPYLTTISWDDVAALNGLSGAEAQLKTFSNGTYSNDQTLGPFEGGFVNITTAKTILIPFQGQTSSGGRRGVPTLNDDINAEAWALPFSVRQGTVIYDLAGIGMAPDADLSIDNYDDLTPPRFFDFLEVNFSHPEHIARNFSRDVVPTQQNYTWNFTIDSNLEGMAELSWNNAPLASSGKDIFLLDVHAQKLMDMKATSSHVFDPKSSSQFRIYFGENLQIAPEEVRLGDAYPNPTSGLTSISFSLPEAGGLNQSVSLEILDNLGRSLGQIKQGVFNPGYHEASFNAAGMVNGFYTYRLNVRNANGRVTQVNKLIIK